jgi:hypothetical protein
MKFDNRSKEAFNTAQLGAVLARGQEYLLPLRFDSNGADVLAYNPSTNETRALQIKGRVTIDPKYSEKKLWIAFPHWISDGQQDWYVVPHDKLVDLLHVKNFPSCGVWSRPKPSRELLDALSAYRVGSVALG